MPERIKSSTSIRTLGNCVISKPRRENLSLLRQWSLNFQMDEFHAGTWPTRNMGVWVTSNIIKMFHFRKEMDQRRFSLSEIRGDTELILFFSSYSIYDSILSDSSREAVWMSRIINHSLNSLAAVILGYDKKPDYSAAYRIILEKYQPDITFIICRLFFI